MNPEKKPTRFRMVRTEDGVSLGWISRSTREEAERVMDHLWPGGGWRLDDRAEDQD